MALGHPTRASIGTVHAELTSTLVSAVPFVRLQRGEPQGHGGHPQPCVLATVACCTPALPNRSLAGMQHHLICFHLRVPEPCLFLKLNHRKDLPAGLWCFCQTPFLYLFLKNAPAVFRFHAMMMSAYMPRGPNVEISRCIVYNTNQDLCYLHTIER